MKFLGHGHKILQLAKTHVRVVFHINSAVKLYWTGQGAAVCIVPELNPKENGMIFKRLFFCVVAFFMLASPLLAAGVESGPGVGLMEVVDMAATRRGTVIAVDEVGLLALIYPDGQCVELARVPGRPTCLALGPRDTVYVGSSGSGSVWRVSAGVESRDDLPRLQQWSFSDCWEPVGTMLRGACAVWAFGCRRALWQKKNADSGQAQGTGRLAGFFGRGRVSVEAVHVGAEQGIPRVRQRVGMVEKVVAEAGVFMKEDDTRPGGVPMVGAAGIGQTQKAPHGAFFMHVVQRAEVAVLHGGQPTPDLNW